MIAFGWVTNMLQRGMASWKRMLEVLDAVPAIAMIEDAERRRAAERRLRRICDATVRLQPDRSAARSSSAT